MTTLNIADGLALPLDAAAARYVILGKSGAGKTSADAVLIEEFIGAGVPTVVLDPLGKMWGLRSSSNGDAAGLPKPWTTDPLLRDYRWCNVSRMDDRVSRELMESWYCEAPVAVQFAAAVLARMVNWPEALLDATGGQPFRLADLPKLREALKARAAAGLKVFTGAYIVPGVPGESKVDSVCDLAGVVAHTATEALQPTLRATWEKLIRWQGIGGFLAGQITSDLAYLAVGRAWPDRFRWAPVGPGSARGINRLLGRPKDKAVPQAQFDGELAAYMALMRTYIAGIDADRCLGAQDYQSTLCEFDKYRRLQLEEGTVRARYDGAGALQETLL